MGEQLVCATRNLAASVVQKCEFIRKVLIASGDEPPISASLIRVKALTDAA